MIVTLVSPMGQMSRIGHMGIISSNGADRADGKIDEREWLVDAGFYKTIPARRMLTGIVVW